MSDLEPEIRPPTAELVGMQFTSTGVGVGQVAPSEHMDTTDPRTLQLFCHFGNRRRDGDRHDGSVYATEGRSSLV